MLRSHRSAHALALLPLAVATGCGGAHHHPGPPPPVVGPPVFEELEPNDTPLLADFIARLYVLDLLYVEGHVEAFGVDLRDHFEFVAHTPMEVDFHLQALDVDGDTDLLVYDPLEDRIVAEYAVGGPVESGTIVIHEYDRPFQIVIEAYGLDTHWELELEVFPYGPSPSFDGDGDGGAAPSATAPGDEGTRPAITARAAI